MHLVRVERVFSCLQRLLLRACFREPVWAELDARLFSKYVFFSCFCFCHIYLESNIMTPGTKEVSAGEGAWVCRIINVSS